MGDATLLSGFKTELCVCVFAPVALSLLIGVGRLGGCTHVNACPLKDASVTGALEEEHCLPR